MLMPMLIFALEQALIASEHCAVAAHVDLLYLVRNLLFFQLKPNFLTIRTPGSMIPEKQATQSGHIKTGLSMTVGNVDHIGIALGRTAISK